MTLFSLFSQFTVVNDKNTVDFPLPKKRMSVKSPFEQSFVAWTEKKSSTEISGTIHLDSL